jgi:hypothetical protein
MRDCMCAFASSVSGPGALGLVLAGRDDRGDLAGGLVGLGGVDVLRRRRRSSRPRRTGSRRARARPTRSSRRRSSGGRIRDRGDRLLLRALRRSCRRAPGHAEDGAAGRIDVEHDRAHGRVGDGRADLRHRASRPRCRRARTCPAPCARGARSRRRPESPRRSALRRRILVDARALEERGERLQPIRVQRPGRRGESGHHSKQAHQRTPGPEDAREGGPFRKSFVRRPPVQTSALGPDKQKGLADEPFC